MAVAGNSVHFAGVSMIVRLCALLLLAFALSAPAQIADDQCWSEFANWLKDYTGAPAPEAMLQAYRNRLVSSGLPDTDVQARIATIQRLAPSHEVEFTALRFDRIYSGQQNLFRTEPTPFLVRLIENLPTGKALDIGMGQGRNSLYLARKGWDVTGYDVSDQGLAIARKSAEQAGLKPNFVRASHGDFDFGVERWDLIVMIYSLAPMEDRSFLERVRRSLKPGGYVLVEQFNSPSAEVKGPPNALINSFRDYRTIVYEDVVDTSEWGFRKARLGRIFAQKE